MEFFTGNEFKVLGMADSESHQLIFPGNSASERTTITRVFAKPGSVRPRHKHPSSEQIWIALKGKATLLLGGDEIKSFEEGDVARFEDGDVHGLHNNSNSEFQYLAVTCPPIDFRNWEKSERV